MRFSNLMLGVSALVVFAEAKEAGGGADVVETDNVDGERIKLTQIDIDNIKTIIADSQAIKQAGDDGWMEFESKDEVLSFVHGLVLVGAYPDISTALVAGVADLTRAANELGITDVTEYLAQHPKGDDLFDFDDVDFDDDVDPEYIDLIDAMFGGDSDSNRERDAR